MRLHKRQRAKHEEIQYFHEHISNLKRKMALPLLVANHQGFVNESIDSMNNEKFSDVTLRIQFENVDLFPTFIDIQTHRVILSRKSAYFDRLFSKFKDTGLNKVIPLHIALHYNDAPVVVEFFRLFGVSVIGDNHFTAHQYEFIVTNVLIMHHLAEQFLFHALRKYCKHKIYERFDVSLFDTIFNQSVARRNNNNNSNEHNTNIETENEESNKPLYVIPGRESLFRRLIAWFVCCADTHGNHLPYIELSGNMVTEDNHITGAPNSLIPPPQQHNEDYNRKRKRLSSSNDKKVETLLYMREAIENFDLFDLYSFAINHDIATKTTRIRSFGRLCESCVHSKNTLHVARINQIMPEGSRRKWHFYLEIEKDQSSLYVRVDNMSSTSLPTMLCKSQVTVLSKLYKNEPQVSPTVMSSLDTFTKLNQFCINEAEFCYHGECDICHVSQTRLFIVKYEIEAVNML